MLHELLHGSDVAAQLELAWTVNGSLDFHHIGEYFNRTSADMDRITVLHPEVLEILGGHRMHVVDTSVVALNVNLFLPGAAGESSGVIDQRRHGFSVLQLIEHRTLHEAVDAHKGSVGGNVDDVSFLKGDIGLKLAVEDIVVNVHGGEFLTAANHLYVAQGTYLGDASGTIDRIEYGGERRQPVSAGRIHLSKDVDHDGAHVPESQRHL